MVYGDIGTSPLYALRLAVRAASETDLPSPATVVAAVSAILWSLIIVVSAKYAVLILRADNHGEGGILSLFALLRSKSRPRVQKTVILALAVIGAGLLYGDGAITPAISVLSAIEGLKVDAPQLAPYVVPITLAILLGLFAFQRTGTGFIGKVFGPFMLLWFLTLAVLGIIGIGQAPEILQALNPLMAVHYGYHAGPHVAFLMLGAVFLAVTGSEALYADLGHFGRRPIRLAWFSIVLPGLFLNYSGQGALLLHDPGAISNPFYRLAPSWAYYPLVLVATRVTVIASQAVISGVFSITRQAVQLGVLPRLRMRHTAKSNIGQIYMPTVNWLLAFVTIVIVLAFRTSDAIAGAYGISVSLLMTITTLLAGLLARQWGYGLGTVVLVNGLFLFIDVLFSFANSLKFLQGGWFSLFLALTVAFLMLTWRQGQLLLERSREKLRQSQDEFLQNLATQAPIPLPGTAVFLSPARTGVPLPLTSFLRHNHALHERIFILTVATSEKPNIQQEKRVEVAPFTNGINRILLRYGYMEQPDIPQGLRLAFAQGKLDVDPDVSELCYFLGRETVISGPHSGGSARDMSRLRAAIFLFMQRNSLRSAAYFRIPAILVVQMGIEIEI